MSVWDSYDEWLRENGKTTREAAFDRESRYLTRQLPKSLSYRTVTIDGVERDLAVIDSDNYNIKTLLSMPGEDIDCGGLVDWMGNKWLITNKDANNELYTRVKMKQCNHLLRWIHSDKTIVRQWCIVEDGTRYLTGETEGFRNDVNLYVGDTRITVLLPRNEYTAKLTRDQRFLIDDPDSTNVLAYRMSKPFKIGGVYNGKGVMAFVLTEENTTDDDNIELRIADYYKYFPRDAEPANTVEPDDSVAAAVNNGKKVWL